MAKLDLSWWEQEAREDEHTPIFRLVERMQEAQSWRREQLEIAVCLYDDAPLLGLTPGTFSVQRVSNPAQLAYNVIKSC